MTERLPKLRNKTRTKSSQIRTLGAGQVPKVAEEGFGYDVNIMDFVTGQIGVIRTFYYIIGKQFVAM
jgi:hypothetical protein